ncbi:DUF3261 domain-containing protein [Undibacterium sp. Di27W]|uniref:DUF3261 domain-containing protein n=1 Tax=Undibacterium sp. Di27W TaxID=3413036 RepID=UPI003BF12382
MSLKLKSWLSLAASVAALALLSACASKPVQPEARLGLMLAPAALDASFSVQQHLIVERNGRIDELDAALEVEPGHLELVGLAFGQRVLSLSYDGKQLKSWRHVMLPAQVRAEDVLEDMQLSLWPVNAIVQALPAGWRVEEQGLHRSLYLDDKLVVTVDYSGMPRWSGTVVLNNLRYHYRLTIQSAP